MGDVHDGVNFMRAACVIAVEKAKASFEPMLEVRTVFTVAACLHCCCLSSLLLLVFTVAACLHCCCSSCIGYSAMSASVLSRLI
jgi:hypothetical protein